MDDAAAAGAQYTPPDAPDGCVFAWVRVCVCVMVLDAPDGVVAVMCVCMQCVYACMRGCVCVFVRMSALLCVRRRQHAGAQVRHQLQDR